MGLKDLARSFERSVHERLAFPQPAWEISDRRLFDRYAIARKGSYDPQTDLPWNLLDPDQYNEEERIALRYYWSRHAIFEYSLIMQITTGIQQAILEGYPSEVKQLLMMHLRDEWSHTEMTAEAAGRLGGTLILPSLPAFYKRQYEQRVKSLGKDIHPIFTRLSFSEMVAGHAWYGPFREVSDPLARAIFSFVYTDENRHSRSNWEWCTKGVENTEMRVPDEVRSETEDLLKNIANEKAPIYGWLGFGYTELPKEEQEFHKQCMQIAKELGVTLFDADEFLREYTQSSKTLSKLLDQAGYHVQVD